MKLLTITAAVVVLLYCSAVAVVLCPLPAAAAPKTKEEKELRNEKLRKSKAKKKQFEEDTMKQFEEVRQEFGNGKRTAAMTAALLAVGESLKTVQLAKASKEKSERVRSRKRTKRKTQKVTKEQLEAAEEQLEAAEEQLEAARKELGETKTWLSTAKGQLKDAMKQLEEGEQAKVELLLDKLEEMVQQNVTYRPIAEDEQERRTRIKEYNSMYNAKKRLKKVKEQLGEKTRLLSDAKKTNLLAVKQKQEATVRAIEKARSEPSCKPQTLQPQHRAESASYGNPLRRTYGEQQSSAHGRAHADSNSLLYRPQQPFIAPNHHHHHQQLYSGDSTSRKRKADPPIRQQLLDRRAGAAQALVTLDPSSTDEEAAKRIDHSLRDAVHGLVLLSQSPPSAVPQRSSQQ